MRLKSISLHGFKSFLNRTEIPLGSGITAIVGPNGCGKSNVSDAIRWVLGEGNVRNIRGENILDVIFKGAGNAKAAGFAEVTLLIDNEDHALPLDQVEVAIARRVHRTGESEFLINNLSCRLKDIRSLFLGTGLGSQGYSVIERGMVDAVLSERDDQRRLFFEEAAGISRYKIQRKEAVRKLEATEQDLLRIDDIVREIEREVRSLARQVGKARKHRRLHDQIRDLEVALALRQWIALEGRRAACASEHDVEASDRERLAGEQVRKEAEHETRKIHLIECEEALEETRRRREGLLVEQSEAREEVGVLATRIQAWEMREAELSRRITEETQRGNALRARIEELRPQADQLREELERQRVRVEEAEGEFAKAERRLHAARQESSRTAQVQMEHLVARTKESQELESVRSQVEQLERRCGELETHLGRLEAKTEELAGVIREHETEIQALEVRVEESDRRREDNLTARGLAEQERERLRQHREERARQRASLESRLNLLQEQKSRHEGFDAGVRHLLEHREEIPGILGVVGELIVPDAELAPPVVEAVLAEAVQWIVVRDEAAALAALERLRAAGHGGVTFFPLKENAGRFAEAVAHWGGRRPVAGTAELGPLVEMLLARLRPAENRQEAREAARRAAGPALRHLSPEGEIYASEGWVRTGGGSGGDREILERMQEIPRLEEAFRQIEEEEERIAREVRGYEEEIAKLAETGRDLEAEHAEHADRFRRLDRERSERQVERGLLLEELARVVAELETDRRRLTEMQQERSALEARLGESGATEQEADRRHCEAKEAEEASARERDRLLESLSGCRTEAVRLENGLREVENAIGRDAEEVARLETALRQWDGERAETVRSRQEALARRAEVETRTRQLEVRLGEVEKELDRRRRERDEEQTHLAAQEQEIKRLRSELDGLQEKLHDQRVRELEIRAEMDRIRERILQEFRVDLIEEQRRRDETQRAAGGQEAEGVEVRTEEEQRLEIAELRQKLLKIGPVNFLASEEYDRQKERLLFHRKERDDLRKARQDLLEAIRRINETAGQMFQETFILARQHFRETFEQLFPGGEADLHLVGEDPLEASIEIAARPRGKKLEAIRLLSTGERSLTAIALLFGIYLVKPSPFCILDELDAPLDDVNIGRFVTMLRHFSGRTQFVVITHNKRTMEAADRLYGVTMQEAGVSNIVSVQLSDADLDLTPEAAQVLSTSGEDDSNG